MTCYQNDPVDVSYINKVEFCWCNSILLMRLNICEFLRKSKKSQFLTQNVRFPAWVGDISRRGIERSNHETLSRVPPRSFGPMVNFLEKSKNWKILDFQKCWKISFYAVWSHQGCQYGSYDLDIGGAQSFTRVHVSKIFVCENMWFWLKSSILDLEILEKSPNSLIWVGYQQAHRWLPRSPISIWSSDSDRVTNFTHGMYWGHFPQKYFGIVYFWI